MSMINTQLLPTIGADRILLRWLNEQDVQALFGIFSNEEVMEYWSRMPFTKIEEAKELLENIHEGFKRGSLYQWGIVINV